MNKVENIKKLRSAIDDLFPDYKITIYTKLEPELVGMEGVEEETEKLFLSVNTIRLMGERKINGKIYKLQKLYSYQYLNEGFSFKDILLDYFRTFTEEAIVKYIESISNN